MRLFVAAELPEAMLDALAETSARLRDCGFGRGVGERDGGRRGRGGGERDGGRRGRGGGERDGGRRGRGGSQQGRASRGGHAGGGRFVGPDLFHVTLAFLGEVPAARVDEAAGLVDAGCADLAAFHTSLGALGTFGRSSDAILWQGFSAGREEWDSLAAHVRSALRDGGFELDAKGFVPHVTLVRRANVTGGVLPMPAVADGMLSTVTLFRSDLSGVRPRYDALERVYLGE